MSRRVKLALIIVGAIFVLAATCISGAWYWREHNSEALQQTARQGQREGAAFGTEATDAEACITEGLRRSAECGQMEIACRTGSQMFTRACFGTAPADETLCEGVPGPGEVMDSVTWITEQCTARGQSENLACQNVLSALQDHCTATKTP